MPIIPHKYSSARLEQLKRFELALETYDRVLTSPIVMSDVQDARIELIAQLNEPIKA